MTIIFRRELDDLTKMALTLSGQVEENLRKAIKAIIEKDESLAEEVIQADGTIDAMEVEVEEECLKILALHQPVAVDLRYIVAVLKINNDLERIGDICSALGNRCKLLMEDPSYAVPHQIQEMADKVREMLRNSLDALVKNNADTAREVCAADEVVDNLNRQVYDEVKAQIEKDGSKVQSQLNLLTVSRRLERIADHTTNIAEDVLYLVTGEIYRHRHTED